MLNDEQRRALFQELHQSIETTAVEGSVDLAAGVEPQLHYPPNHGFTAAELAALAALPGDPNLTSAFRKILASAASRPIFDLLRLLDGVMSPSSLNTEWLGVQLVPYPEPDEVPEVMLDGTLSCEPPFLYYDFYETYWEWREVRDDTGWRLDTYEG